MLQPRFATTDGAAPRAWLDTTTNRGLSGTIRWVSGFVDLRSDTVTRPTPAMRQAMAEAEVGDDGYGEDPTVARLEERFAERVGMEAALYVPSGIMANQLAVRVLGRPGHTVIVGRSQHLAAYEDGAAGLNLSTQLALIDDGTGVIDPAAVRWARQAASHHWPSPGLVAIENTHMAAGGHAWSLEDLAALHAALGDLPLYVDGARIFNAEVATGVAAARLVAGATAMMACLSKGLCAPVGSVFAGSRAVVDQARRERRRLGGSMRQSGVIAAAGLVALSTMVERLAEDHARARRLALAVAERWPSAGFDPDSVQTNIVLFAHHDPDGLLEHLRTAGVLGGTVAPGTVRLVTHHDVDDLGIERAMVALAQAPT